MTRTCPYDGKNFETENPRKIFCNKQCADRSRNLPKIQPGANGDVSLEHFSKFSQEIRNDILLGKTGAKIALYDIEATHLDANVGRILCCVIKELGDHDHEIYTAHDRKYKRRDNFDDSALASDLRDRLEDFDIIIGHNSKMFDTKFINARNLRVGQRTKRAQYQVDTYWSWKSKARAWSSLSAIQQFIQTPTKKTSISWGAWMNALGWDRALRITAMADIVDHCILDVDALEEVYLRLVNANVIRSLRHDGGVL